MVEGSMTQGAGQGPGMWQGGDAVAHEAGAQGAPGHPAAHRPAPASVHAEHTRTSAPSREETSAPSRDDGHPDEPDDGYTPTERDLPVVDPSATDEGREPTLVDLAAAPVTEEGDGPLYVVGDVHGYLDELRDALRDAGITDQHDNWAAGNTRLWFLGDFTDRGPDGIGVIDLVMHLSAQAAAAGGYCKALMGNHELLLIGAKKFGDTPVNSSAGTASFQAAWLLNGGQHSDMERLEDHHIQWMSRLDAMALADGHLLLHSDATCYLDYGTTIEGVNDAITEALQRNDADETWDLFRKFTKRFAFREETGSLAARELLTVFGGRQIVHGHSPIPYLLGEPAANGAADTGDGGEDEDAPPEVTGPHLYADGLALAMDGGVTMDGKLLVTQLPLAD
ncbi:serine/threonine protein phosphatase [Streptomyces bathyalis]|uniref:Serine/threonine protein phosphatase n=1 Tax=Streptomyces bathyalis TaxID=2710756 RepID=A0A7T1WSK1_9ACTN|nr:metallophosphoesterase [Streptomyces bathyalis]QPP07616.1 serine/threonine protein phosphatase [Streptomyces bathyalis]